MSSVISVVLHPSKPVKSVQLYRVELEDGTVLVESTRDPEFAACRALHAKRVKGILETRRRGSQTVCMRINIKWGVTRSTAEGPTYRHDASSGSRLRASSPRHQP